MGDQRFIQGEQHPLPLLPSERLLGKIGGRTFVRFLSLETCLRPGVQVQRAILSISRTRPVAWRVLIDRARYWGSAQLFCQVALEAEKVRSPQPG